MKEEKLLRIHIDGNLNFDQYVNQLLKNKVKNSFQNLQIRGFWEIPNFHQSFYYIAIFILFSRLNVPQQKIWNTVYMKSTQGLSPQTQDVNRTYIRRSICVLCVWGCNQCIKNSHDLTFEELLQKMCILINVQILAIEIFKSKKMNIN